jgi:hypothetical protein
MGANHLVQNLQAAGDRISSPLTQVQHSLCHWFKEIPPERLGLYGEYDYYGLRKRVERILHHRLGAAAIAQLRISQRGRVIILSGCVASPEQFHQIEQLILSLPGATQVERRALQYQPGSSSPPSQDPLQWTPRAFA